MFLVGSALQRGVGFHLGILRVREVLNVGNLLSVRAIVRISVQPNLRVSIERDLLLSSLSNRLIAQFDYALLSVQDGFIKPHCPEAVVDACNRFTLFSDGADEFSQAVSVAG